MARPFRELVEDFASDPTQWEVVDTQTTSSTNVRNRGGTSIQEMLRHKKTGEELVRHTLLKPDGTGFSPPHLRPCWK
jgi:hypothetical protein